jgi:hypothetical protein
MAAISGKVNLSYAKLRKCLAVFLKNKVLREKLEGLIAGKEQEISVLGLMDLLDESEADTEIIEILTGKKASEIEADEAVGVISDFFLSMQRSLERLRPMLSSIGLSVTTEVKKD